MPLFSPGISSAFHFVRILTSFKIQLFLVKSSLTIFRSLSAFSSMALSTHMQPFSIPFSIVDFYFYVSNLKLPIISWQGFCHI